MQKGESTISSISALAGVPTGSAEATIISEKLRELNSMMHGCQDERNRSEHNLNNIAKTHERMQLEPQKPYYKQKLRGLYKTAMQDAESEADMLRKSLEIINDIRMTVKSRPRKSGFSKETSGSFRRGALMKMLQQHAMTLPLFIGKSIDEKAPPLCGAIPPEANHAAKLGDMVAALVKGADGDENWILAEVVHYNSSAGKYEIDDIDEEQKERHTLSRRRVVPLPLMRANPETHPEALFPKGTLVLALYPQTTCFYRAIIQDYPKTSQDEYQVLFEDSSYSEGYSPPLCVPQRYVIICKEIRKK